MKKRTLVCFLIFTLCVFYTAIPNTVFGQEEGVALAKQVFDEHGETLQRDDVKALLPEILTGLQGAGDDIDIPGLVDTAIALINAGQGATLQGLAAGQGITLTDDHITLLADADVQTLLTAENTKKLLGLKGAELQAGLTELLRLANEGTPPTDGETPPTDGETPPTDGETPPTDGETPPTDGETPPTDGETPPTDGETPPTDGETPPTDGETPPTDGEIQPPPPIEQANPFDPIMPPDESLLGKSRLGGLSLNSISGRRFVADLFEKATGLPIETLALSGYTQDQLVRMVVEEVAKSVPKEVPFPKNQILNFLQSNRVPIFAGELGEVDLMEGLYHENFGNAIVPMPLDLIYDDGMGDKTDPNRKYLTRNSLNLFVRVPSTLNMGEGVTFKSSDGTLQKAGTRVGDPAVLGSETIPYTFRLEEALAAINLPAWPALENELEQLFESVTLRYSNSGLEADDFSGHEMQPTFGPNGVVWETTTVDVTQGNSYYYFDVVLATPVTLEILDRSKLQELLENALAGNPPGVGDVVNATTELLINSWSMPDPRNLQLVDRGILDALFDSNFRAELTNALGPIIAQASSGKLPVQEVLQALGKRQAKLTKILSDNALGGVVKFEGTFDPLLASVFSVPKLKPDQSLWVASFDENEIVDGNYFIGAVVHDADGNPLDQMWSEVTVDTKAPEADVTISAGNNTSGYQNGDVYIATVSEPGAATLQITGNPRMGPSNYVAEGYGYLFYQIVELNPEDGSPYLGEPSLQHPNTWMPLIPEATMLASTVWDQTIAQLVNQGVLPEELDLGGGTLPTKTITLDTVLAVLGTPIGLGFIQDALNPSFKTLGDLINIRLQLDDKAAQLLVDVFGETVDLINHVPITYGNNNIEMLAQLGGVPLVGDYGIRAMGIDTLFNVSSHTAPTRLRIVDSKDPAHHDRASVTFAVIGDCNMDGDMDDLFESGSIGDVTIFGNTTENVMLTVTVDHRSVHPVDIMVQYMDANGDWQEIGKQRLAANEVMPTFDIPWNVADFDALVAAGDSVKVRAVAINDLGLEDLNPVEGTIMLDAGICPLDPEVIAITVDPATTTNSVSGAPQGMLTLNAYTPSRTSTPITSVRLAAKGPQDAEWPIDTSEVVEDIGGQQLADLLGDLVSTVGSDKPTVNVDSTYRKWSVTVDTTTLADTITAGTDENQYVVTGSAYDANGTELLPPIDGVEAKFSVDNIDRTDITAVADADSAVEANEDGSYSVGGLVDKYDEAVESPMVTFTIKPVSYRGSYASVMLVTDAEGASIGEATETAEGSGVFTVTVDVGTLADGETYLENGTYMFHAVAVDAEDSEVPETDGAKISVNVENNYRPAPEVLALAVDPEGITQTNPDSGAPQGTITFHAYSHEISSPATKAVRLVVKRPGDEEWIDAGEATESTPTTDTPTTEIADTTLADFVGDLASAATDTTVVPINRTYQMWAVEVDTTKLEDTITAESPAARDASKDDNQYMVRAIPIEEAEDFKDPEASPNATAMFSVDNDDDVAPVGPTNIVAVADVAGMIEANEDGSYTVGGIVDDTVPSPIATFTTEPTADPATYASVNLVQATEDGTETVTEGEAGTLDITIDVGVLENGTYMFHALAVDDADPANVQTDESPMITVHVLNFRVSDVTDIAVIAVDGTDAAESPAEPIPLRESVTVSFMVANGSLAADELSGEVNGDMVPSESAEDPENTFSLMVGLGALANEVYTPHAVVTKRNGSVEFPITTVNVDRIGPMVTIESPTEDETVDSLPTIRATYLDVTENGVEGVGVDGTTGTLTLMRLQPPNEAEVVVDQAELEKDAESLVYTRREPLAGGAYRVTVQVTDKLGNVSDGDSTEFTVNGTVPTVAIHSPVSGQTFEHGEPLISGELSGAGTVEVTTFTINDVDATPEVDGNRFSYTPREALTDGSYTVVVAVTDDNGSMAQTSVTFMVEIPEPPKDTTPPVISAAAPNGVIKDADVDKAGSAKISAVVTDEQSAVSSVKYSINGGQLRSIAKSNIVGGKIEAPIDFEAHGPGLYNVRLVATSEGGTTEYTWSFTLIVDNVKPVITSITPSGTIRGGLPVISASANDESGVSKMTITVWDSAGKEVKGKAANDGESDVEGITRVDFNLEEPLDEGVYTIEVRATDPYENSASAKETFSIDFDTAAPVITMASPQNEARLTNRRPLISITYADAESGVDVDSIRFIFNSNVINLKPNQKTASQVLYRPEADLPFGQHTVKLEVSDMAHKEGNVSEKNKGAREANMAVYEFTFFVESVEGPILVARPINVPNPFKDETHISFALTRQSVVSIAIYDSTLRPVRVLMDNKVMDAGNYFGKDGGILWNGKSSGDGEDLARGIYFCQIIVGDGIEPEYAILKLALTR